MYDTQEKIVIKLNHLTGERSIEKFKPIEFPQFSPIPFNPREEKLARFITTFNQYDAYCIDMKKKLPDDASWGRQNRPVIYVNWFSSALFCNWLSLYYNVPPAYIMVQHDNEPQSVWVWLNPNRVWSKDTENGIGTFILPDSQDWEACATIPVEGKKGENYQYAGSNNLKDVAWYADNSGGQTHPVGELKPTPYFNPQTQLFEYDKPGHYDLLGNVWEWMSVQNLPDMNEEDWAKHFPGKGYLELTKKEWCPDIIL